MVGRWEEMARLWLTDVVRYDSRERSLLGFRVQELPEGESCQIVLNRGERWSIRWSRDGEPVVVSSAFYATPDLALAAVEIQALSLELIATIE
jgi:hypothetical protein